MSRDRYAQCDDTCTADCGPCKGAGRPASLPSSPLPPEQWSAGMTSPTTLTGCDETSKLRAWLWQHTAQPNGDPWTDDPDHLDRAATDLATTLAGGTP